MFAWLMRLRRRREDQQQILDAMGQGWTLKSHRFLDGAKVYRLHSLDGEIRQASAAAVEALLQQGLIQSNQKFPAATFLLTETGRALAGQASTPAVDPGPPPKRG